jgi:hypothetical protein
LRFCHFSQILDVRHGKFHLFHGHAHSLKERPDSSADGTGLNPNLGMNITDELQKLADLRKEGSLTEAEFADAKRRLLAQGEGGSAPLPSAGAASATPAGSPVEDRRYRSSRWSSGNMFFPDSLTLASDGILFRKGKLFGSSEERISYKAIASLRVTHGFFLSNVSVETSGGSQPIFINGLWKSDARAVQDGIREFQRIG